MVTPSLPGTLSPGRRARDLEDVADGAVDVVVVGGGVTGAGVALDAASRGLSVAPPRAQRPRRRGRPVGPPPRREAPPPPGGAGGPPSSSTAASAIWHTARSAWRGRAPASGPSSWARPRRISSGDCRSWSPPSRDGT